MPTRHAEIERPAVEQMLRYLTAQQRQALVATYFRRRTTRDAARQLGVDHDAVRARLYHAMRDLTGMLKASRPDAAPVRGRAAYLGRLSRPSVGRRARR